jgi:hypothetical protein
MKVAESGLARPPLAVVGIHSAEEEDDDNDGDDLMGHSGREIDRESLPVPASKWSSFPLRVAVGLLLSGVGFWTLKASTAAYRRSEPLEDASITFHTAFVYDPKGYTRDKNLEQAARHYVPVVREMRHCLRVVRITLDYVKNKSGRAYTDRGYNVFDDVVALNKSADFRWLVDGAQNLANALAMAAAPFCKRIEKPAPEAVVVLVNSSVENLVAQRVFGVPSARHLEREKMWKNSLMYLAMPFLARGTFTLHVDNDFTLIDRVQVARLHIPPGGRSGINWERIAAVQNASDLLASPEQFPGVGPVRSNEWSWVPNALTAFQDFPLLVAAGVPRCLQAGPPDPWVHPCPQRKGCAGRLGWSAQKHRWTCQAWMANNRRFRELFPVSPALHKTQIEIMLGKMLSISSPLDAANFGNLVYTDFGVCRVNIGGAVKIGVFSHKKEVGILSADASKHLRDRIRTKIGHTLAPNYTFHTGGWG